MKLENASLTWNIPWKCQTVMMMWLEIYHISIRPDGTEHLSAVKEKEDTSKFRSAFDDHAGNCGVGRYIFVPDPAPCACSGN